jgi:DnaJ-class molecular chaperone
MVSVKLLNTEENMKAENLILDTCLCSNCNGTGYVFDTDGVDEVLIPCQDCVGSGYVDDEEPSFELPLYKIYEKVD